MVRIVLAVVSLFIAAQASAQHSLLYEVSGAGLKKPSYLFGTFHLLTESFVDSQKVVKKKLKKSKAVAGELVTDSLLAMGTAMMTSLRTDTPLDKLLTPTAYVELNAWTYDLVGMDLTMFQRMPPAVVSALLVRMLYARHFDYQSDEKPMDVYIQDYARKKKKAVFGLESMQVQMDALFKRPLKRQAEQLEKMVAEKDSLVPQMRRMLSLYRRADFDALQNLMYEEEGFNDDEIKTLLTDRNRAWLEQLPSMMKQQPTFVAVGALHLAGPNGLVEGLRSRGYTVTPLPLR